MMKKLIFILLLTPMYLLANEQLNTIQRVFLGLEMLAEQKNEPDKVRNKDNAWIACEKLGDKCQKYLTECIRRPQPFTCLSQQYLGLETAKEICGLMNYEYCYKENIRQSSIFLFEILQKHKKNPRFSEFYKKCELEVPIYNIKGTDLIEFKKDMAQKSGHPIELFDYKENNKFNICILGSVENT